MHILCSRSSVSFCSNGATMTVAKLKDEPLAFIVSSTVQGMDFDKPHLSRLIEELTKIREEIEKGEGQCQ